MIRLELEQNIKLSTAEFLEKNKSAWEKKVQFDVESEYYNVKGFLDGQNILDDIEIEAIGSVVGKDVLHLQCYFGLESLSLERMGARVTGLDFCENAIKEAIRLRDMLSLKTSFICANVYDATEIIKDQYDIVFSSYGSICWLPDLQPWANSVYSLLKPGGSLYLIDFHPLLISFDLLRTDHVEFPYFNIESPIKLLRKGTYADINACIETVEYNWNHSLSEIVNSLIAAGLELESMNEYPFIPIDAFPNLESFDNGFNHVPNDLFPITISIAARKKNE